MEGFHPLITVREIRRLYSQSQRARQTVLQGTRDFFNILTGKDKRMVIICGPCSIHCRDSALEYSHFLLQMRQKMKKKLCLIMRVYFEKPRTVFGWKGFIYDPHLDGSNDVFTGLKWTRELLVKINDLGVPAASELLDPTLAPYLNELVSWVAIGARTTASPIHRQLASGLRVPIGYKNSTDGNLLIAINAMKAARHPQSYIGFDDDGRSGVFETNGNLYGHIILRGSHNKPNFHIEDIMQTEDLLEKHDFDKKIMVDCSHDNSYKDHKKQILVIKDVIAQIKMGNRSIFGFMLESNLYEGCQPLSANPKHLKYGVSITDKCLHLKDTQAILERLYESLDIEP